MAADRPPAIRRDWQTADSEASIEHVVHDDTSFERGLGDSGRKVEHVEYECPCCGHDEMIRIRYVNPVDRDGAVYWCLMPNCRYFVADALSWATKPHPQHKPETPMVWTQTYVCTECGDRWTDEITRDQYRHLRVEDGLVKDACESCLYDQLVDA